MAVFGAVGKRNYLIHILCGGIVSHLTLLEKTLAMNWYKFKLT